MDPWYKTADFNVVSEEHNKNGNMKDGLVRQLVPLCSVEENYLISNLLIQSCLIFSSWEISPFLGL